MKEYLKMADVFGLPLCRFVDDGSVGNVVDANGESIIYIQQTTKLKIAENRNYIAEFAAHAINSHDELVTMNKELFAALEAVIEWYDMEADHSIEPDFYRRMAACQVSEDMAREAIAKAKAAS